MHHCSITFDSLLGVFIRFILAKSVIMLSLMFLPGHTKLVDVSALFLFRSFFLTPSQVGLVTVSTRIFRFGLARVCYDALFCRVGI